jgi:hypothetical protein
MPLTLALTTTTVLLGRMPGKRVAPLTWRFPVALVAFCLVCAAAVFVLGKVVDALRVRARRHRTSW